MLLSQASSQGAATSRPLSVSEAMQAAKRSLESITVKLIGEDSEVNAAFHAVRTEGPHEFRRVFHLPCR